MSSSSSGSIRTIEDPRRDDIPATIEQFLRWLGGPTILRLSGRDRSRCRGFATLLHGNEPSGPVALHRWLRSGAVPAVDVIAFVGAVDAALEPPGFNHRMLDGRRDLNRCFLSPHEDRESRIADELVDILCVSRCEALIDVHNNSGHNPAYGIATAIDSARMGLISLFAGACVHSDLRLGTLVEALEGEVPSVAVECGRSGDPGADEVALRGLGTYFERDDLCLTGELDRPMTIFDEPIRVCLRGSVRVSFSDGPDPDADCTIDDDIDRHNFEVMAAGERVGWLAAGAEWPFEAWGAGDVEVSRQFFEVREGVIQTRQDLVPVMMTTDPRSAAIDCLCYLVRQRQWSAGELAVG